MNEDNSTKSNSSNVLLIMAKDEYSKESEISNTLDNKSSFFITAIIAITTLFVPIIPFKHLIAFFKLTTGTRMVITIISLVVLFFAFILLTIAIKNFYDAYKITDYKAANLETISDKTNFDKATNQLEKELCDHYKEIVDYNANVNLSRCKFIEHGIAFCVFGFIGLIISTIALIIVIGE